MTYMTSYMRAHGSPNVTYEDFVVVQSTWGMTQGTVMPMSGLIIHYMGERASMTVGAFLFRYHLLDSRKLVRFVEGKQNISAAKRVSFYTDMCCRLTFCLHTF